MRATTQGRPYGEARRRSFLLSDPSTASRSPSPFRGGSGLLLFPNLYPPPCGTSSVTRVLPSVPVSTRMEAASP